jgi:hypothetical protein
MIGAAVVDRDCAVLIRERLDTLALEAAIAGIAQHDIKGRHSLGAEQSYKTGGYPQARLTMVDTLETALSSIWQRKPPLSRSIHLRCYPAFALCGLSLWCEPLPAAFSPVQSRLSAIASHRASR